MKTLWLITARNCNFGCPYCYQSIGHTNSQLVGAGLTGMMSKSVADRGLRWALDWADDETRVTLYGGEPLLAWPLIRAVVPEWREAFAARGKGVTFSATTNGMAFRRSEVREFFDEQRMGFLLSLDGPKRLHDRSRVLLDGKTGTWDVLDPPSILRWRPDMEIAWTLNDGDDFEPRDVDELRALGFRRQNYNLNFLTDWTPENQLRLQRFFKHVGRLVARGELQTNWHQKYIKAGTVDQRMERPCGVGSSMLALTPEGWLYTSQELAWTVFAPERAPGTAEYYRVGDVSRQPVLDPMALARVGLLKTVDMKPKPEFSCDDCVARSASIGGCHCRYAGSAGYSADGSIIAGDDPARRTDVPRGYCQSMRAALTGFMMGMWIERRLRPEEFYADKSQATLEQDAGKPCFPERETLTFGGEK